MTSSSWRHPGRRGALLYGVTAGTLAVTMGLVSRGTIAKARGQADIIRRLPDGPLIVIANHTSFADGIVLALLCRRLGRSVRMLATGGVFRAPLIGPVLRQLGFVPVHRGTAAAKDALDAAAEALAAGEAVALFPEGRLTRNSDQWPERAKTGAVRLALRTGVPIVPVAIEGAHLVAGRTGMLRRMVVNPVLRPEVRSLVGEPIDVVGLMTGPETPHEVRRVADVVMARLIDLLEELREEVAPAEAGVDRV